MPYSDFECAFMIVSIKNGINVFLYKIIKKFWSPLFKTCLLTAFELKLVQLFSWLPSENFPKNFLAIWLIKYKLNKIAILEEIQAILGKYLL